MELGYRYSYLAEWWDNLTFNCLREPKTTHYRYVSVTAVPVPVCRRGADRGQRDCDDMTPLDHAQQRRHTECIRILQTYGLRRPMSAISVTSQVSLGPPTIPLLDEHGHVPLRRPKRQFSLSGMFISSTVRLPADGQAHSEDSPLEEQPTFPTGQTGQDWTSCLCLWSSQFV